MKKTPLVNTITVFTKEMIRGDNTKHVNGNEKKLKQNTPKECRDLRLRQLHIKKTKQSRSKQRELRHQVKSRKQKVQTRNDQRNENFLT